MAQYISEHSINFAIESITTLPGYLYGQKQHIVHLNAIASRYSNDHQFMRAIYDLIEPHLPKTKFSDISLLKLNEIGGIANLQIFLALCAGLQDAAGGIVIENSVFLPTNAQKKDLIALKIAMPTIQPNLGVETAKALKEFIKQESKYVIKTGKINNIEDKITNIVKRLGALTPSGTNCRKHVETAYKHDIPHIRLPAQVIQFGYGNGARLFMSTTSDQTSAIGAIWAKNKYYTHQLLSKAGFPVAKQILVTSQKRAQEAAQKLGYPVVVKAADLDQGKAVFPNLIDDDEVANSFQKVAKESEFILVEKHIEGRDYRVNMFNSNFTYAVECVPAKIIGDGQHTIKELIEKENTNPLRGTLKDSPSCKIVIDENMIAYLKKSGKTLNSVPLNTEFVRLRDNANISTGGTSHLLEKPIHPLNEKLCQDVVKLFNLDIAGLDIICEDLISKPIAETGGVICEVNNSPQIGVAAPHAFHFILESYGPRSDRMPAIGIKLSQSAQEQSDPYLFVLHQLLDRQGPKKIIFNWSNLFFKTGLPVDRLNTLLIEDITLSKDKLFKSLSLLLPFLRGAIILADNHPYLLELEKLRSKHEVLIVPPQALESTFENQLKKPPLSKSQA